MKGGEIRVNGSRAGLSPKRLVFMSCLKQSFNTYMLLNPSTLCMITPFVWSASMSNTVHADGCFDTVTPSVMRQELNNLIPITFLHCLFTKVWQMDWTASFATKFLACGFYLLTLLQSQREYLQNGRVLLLGGSAVKVITRPAVHQGRLVISVIDKNWYLKARNILNVKYVYASGLRRLYRN